MKSREIQENHEGLILFLFYGVDPCHILWKTFTDVVYIRKYDPLYGVSDASFPPFPSLRETLFFHQNRLSLKKSYFSLKKPFFFDFFHRVTHFSPPLKKDFSTVIPI